MQKFYNFTLCLICISHLYNFATCSATDPCNCTQHVTLHSHFRNTILKRRIRSAVFPQNAFVLLSPAFTKAVIDGRPSGVSYSIEFDMYSALPDTIDGWKPTILVNKVKKEKEREEKLKQGQIQKEVIATPPPITVMDDEPVNLNEIDTHLNSHNFHGDIIEDGVDSSSLWPNDASDHYEFPVDDEHNLFDASPSTISDRRYKSVPSFSKYDFNGRENIREFYMRNNKFYKNTSSKPYENNIFKQFHKFPRLYSHKKDPNSYTYNEKWSDYGPKEEIYETLEEVPAWKYHQGYRERREIFSQLEAVGKIFNFNMKSCIQRAMCEISAHLRPYGESLMEDIVRIILTIPNDPNFNDDDYSRHKTRKQQNINCEIHYAVRCPYRVLDILTKGIRNINLADVMEKM